MQGVKIFTSVLLILCFGIIACQANLSISNPQNAPDLPGFQPNFQNIPAGSLIIPMDQQQIHDASGLQSLLPYGLTIRTLYANVSVSWAIATGKPLSGADFTATTKSALFGAVASAQGAAANNVQWGGWGAATTRTYFGGPFVILANNVPKALAAYNTWKSNPNSVFHTVQSNVYDNVVIHYLVTGTTVDIRHTINQRPFVAVSNLDGNAPTQTAMLGCVYQNSTRACPREDGSGWGSIFGTQASTGVPCGAFTPIDHAGLEFGIHFTTYDCGQQVVDLTNADNCLATFSEPHWGWISTSGPTYITALKNFINSGANFLAQCASTESYENSGGINGQGTFLSNYGLEAVYPSNGINVQPSEALNTITNYPDLPVAQWMGPISSAITGAVPDWYNLFSAEPDTPPAGWQTPTQLNSEAGYNNFKPNAFPIATDVYNSQKNFNGRNLYIAAGVKYNSNNRLGSNIFYLGGHTWAGVTTAGTDNGRRLLLNAIVIPALRPVSCGLFFCTPYATCSNNGNPCQTCQCDPSGSTFVYTPIAGCCLNNSACTGACQTCNTATNKCILTPGCCSPSAGINCTATCTQCSVTSGVGTCTGQANCCQTNAQCGTGACVSCVDHACVTTQPPACCNTNVDCTQKCFNCTNNKCQQATSATCCLSNADCGGAANPCSICDTTTNQCVPKPGCCNVNADCGTNPCAQCANNVCVRKNPCCENTGQCGACTYCSNQTNLCVASTDKSCCTTDADCGSCRRCAPGANGASTCLAISDCCITSADCEVCQNCTANQCTLIDSCCRFDADCQGCDVCEDYVCESIVRLDCCQTNDDCNNAAAILRANNTNPNVTISGCPYACEIPSTSTLGKCIPACSSPKSYTGLIVGLAVGIPLGLLALLALAAIVALIIIKKRDALTAKFVRKDPNLQGDAQSNPLHKPANPVQHNQAYNT